MNFCNIISSYLCINAKPKMQLKKSHLLLTIALLLFQPCAAQYDSDSSFIPPQATELGWKTFHPGDVSVPIDACGDSLLHVLFPGKFHKEISFSDDTISMIYWLCHECKPVLSVYDYMPDFSEYVPDSAWNTTVELFDTLIISETGHFRFFFFLHLAIVFLHIPSHRIILFRYFESCCNNCYL